MELKQLVNLLKDMMRFIIISINIVINIDHKLNIITVKFLMAMMI